MKEPVCFRMTHNFQYGKTFDVQADSISHVASTMTNTVTTTNNTGIINQTGALNVTGNVAITGNETVSGTLTVAGNTVTGSTKTTQVFTNAAGSARTDAGTALTAYLFASGSAQGKVECILVPGNLATVANAVAAAPMTFNETIPAGYRPTQNVQGILGIENNGAANTVANFLITTAGVLTFYGGLNSINFNNAAACALLTTPSIIYNIP